MLEHRAIGGINANGAKREINRAINVAHGICRSHLTLDNGEYADVKRASVLFRPRLKRHLNTERSEVRIKEIINLINLGSASNRVERSSQPRRVKGDEVKVDRHHLGLVPYVRRWCSLLKHQVIVRIECAP
jgi:hypothetical protein